jgi:hypothetical protein
MRDRRCVRGVCMRTRGDLMRKLRITQAATVGKYLLANLLQTCCYCAEVETIALLSTIGYFNSVASTGESKAGADLLLLPDSPCSRAALFTGMIRHHQWVGVISGPPTLLPSHL